MLKHSEISIRNFVPVRFISHLQVLAWNSVAASVAGLGELRCLKFFKSSCFDLALLFSLSRATSPQIYVLGISEVSHGRTSPFRSILDIYLDIGANHAIIKR